MNKPLSPALQRLLAEFGKKLPDKFVEIQNLHVAESAISESALSDYYTAVHKLAGSSGSYGFPTVSVCARELDRYLSDVRAGEVDYDPNVAHRHLDELEKVINATQDNL